MGVGRGGGGEGGLDNTNQLEDSADVKIVPSHTVGEESLLCPATLTGAVGLLVSEQIFLWCCVFTSWAVKLETSLQGNNSKST